MSLKPLWAPWRMEYILREKPAPGGPPEGEEGCVFCGLLEEEDGPGNLILHRGERAYVVMNRYPYSNGHLMVVPKRHVKEFESLSGEEGAAIFRLSQICISALRRALGAQGFNAGMNLGKVAGAGIDPHLHFHVVPRWEGDHNFMTVLGEVRVIPEHLQATYGKLRGAFAESLGDSPA